MTAHTHGTRLRIGDGKFVLVQERIGESRETFPHVAITRDTSIRIGCFTIEAEAFKALVEKWNQTQDPTTVVQP